MHSDIDELYAVYIDWGKPNKSTYNTVPLFLE